MRMEVRSAGEDRIRGLLNSHSELSASSSDLSAEQRKEHAALHSLTSAELSRLKSDLAAYRKKFGFPFVVALKGLGKDDVLRTLSTRLARPIDAELKEALFQA